MRTHVLVSAALSVACGASAQNTAPDEAGITFRTVASALSSLERRDGDGVVVTHPDGWVVVNEPAEAAQWSFVPKDHYAYPAVVRRVVTRSAGGAVSVQVSSLCEAAKEPCARLVEEFRAMNDRLVQSVRARSRQGSTTP
jgi:hypothetical protein